MITVEHLTKCYGNVKAVDDLSFEIGEGSVYGFLGPNGAGKSTTMNIMTGCLSATSGKVEIDGCDIFENPKAAKKLLGYLPEQPPLYLSETPCEYLRFVGEAKGLRGEELTRQIAGVIEETRIGDVRNRAINALSKGYRQRVGIAQALLGSSKTIILDEPTVGLDPLQIVEIRELIRSLGENRTVLLSSHILSEVQTMCSRITTLSHGLLYNYGVLDMYDGGTLDIADGGVFNTTEGVLLYRSNHAEINGEVNGTEWCVDFTPIDGDAAQAHVETEAELIEAMNDGSVVVVVVENGLSLTQPLNVTKPLYVAGSLTMPDGAQITVDGAILCVNGDLVCDSVTVQNGGMAEFLCSWRGASGLTDLTVTGGSWVYTRDSEFEMRGVVVSGGSMLIWDAHNSVPLTSAAVSEGSVLVLTGEDMFSDAFEIDVSGSRVIQLNDMDVTGASAIELDDGAVYRQSGRLDLSEGAEIIIGATSSLYSNGGGLTIAQNASLLNGGALIADSFSDFYGVRVDGTLTNSGALYIGQPIRVSGLLSNQGRIYSNLEAADAVIVESGGAFEGGTAVDPWN